MSLETWQIAEIFNQESSLSEYQFSIFEDRYPFYSKFERFRILQLGGGDIVKKVFNGLSCYVTFINFEKLSLDQNSKDANLSDLVSIRPYIHRKLLKYDFGQDIFDKFPKEINNPNDIKLILKLINKFYLQDAKPFFEYWKDIRMILPFVEQDDENAIELLGNNYIIRKMTLWKLCDHPKYEEFVSQRVSIFEDALNDKPDNEDYLSVLEEVKLKYKELQYIAPDFDWHPDNLIAKPIKPREA